MYLFPGIFYKIYLSKKEIKDYLKCIKYLEMFSPKSQICVLLHKIDLLDKLKNKEEIINSKKKKIYENTINLSINSFFETSIFYESLYYVGNSLVFYL